MPAPDYKLRVYISGTTRTGAFKANERFAANIDADSVAEAVRKLLRRAAFQDGRMELVQLRVTKVVHL